MFLSAKLALVNLAFSAVSLVEETTQTIRQMESAETGNAAESASNAPDKKTAFKAVSAMLSDLLNGKMPEYKAVENLRNANIQAMERVTDDVDIFHTGEFALNRLEHRFHGTKMLSESYSDLALTDAIIKYLSQLPDESQNLLISEIIAELPLRMTKARYFDLLRERLSRYDHGDLSAFYEVLTRIETITGIKGSEEAKALLQELFHADFSVAGQPAFDRFQTEFIGTSEELEAESDFYIVFESALNELMSLSLVSDLAFSDEVFTGPVKLILEKAVKAFSNKKNAAAFSKELENTESELYQACEALEGIPEETHEELEKIADILHLITEQLPKEVSAYGLEERYESLRKLTVLQSDSIFADLSISVTSGKNDDGENSKEENDTEETVTDELFNEKTGELIQKLQTLFDGMDRFFVRVLMARTFSVLPPHFSTQEELEQTIYGALSSCADEAEKLGCIEVIDQLMAEY